MMRYNESGLSQVVNFRIIGFFSQKLKNKKRSHSAMFFVNVGHKEIERTYNKWHLKITQFWRKNLSIENSGEHFKPIASNIQKSESRQKKNNKWTF